MTKNTQQLTDELNGRIDELDRDLDALTEAFARQDEKLSSEGEGNLSAMEAMDLDAELGPVEEEAIQGLEEHLAESLKAVDDASDELDELEADDARDDASDEADSPKV